MVITKNIHEEETVYLGNEQIIVPIDDTVPDNEWNFTAPADEK